MTEKKKVLMVCLVAHTLYAAGNICRSPIAEAVFKSEISKRNLEDQWEVDSAALIGYHKDKVPDSRALSTLRENGITNYAHRARQVTQDDFHKYDWIFGMDKENINKLFNIKPSNVQCRAKIELLGKYDPNKEIIIKDPYYDNGNAGFQKAFEQCLRSITTFLNEFST